MNDCVVGYAAAKLSNRSKTADINSVTVSYAVQLWRMFDV
jgi:hypothetical protein